jgi:hypothetical protein
MAGVFCGILAAAGAAATCAGSAQPAPRLLGHVLTELGVHAPSWAGAVVSKSLRREGRSHVFWTVAAAQGPRAIRVEITTNLGPGAAQRLIDERAVVVRGLYKPATVDYFGVMSGRAAVPEELQPEVLYPERGLLRPGNPAFILWAKKDFSYAVREREAAAYRGLLAFRYCEGRRTLLQVEAFEPAERFDREELLRDFAGLRCADVPR